jgi:hypothetical protein
VNVELTGGPQLCVNADGRLEALLPTSHTESAWRRAFPDALPSRQHAWRISAHEDAITIVFDNEKQFASYMRVAIAAIGSANQEIDALEATLRKLTLGELAKPHL